MLPILLLASILLPGEETNAKGFKPPSVRQAHRVDLKKRDHSREIEGDETVEQTYLDSKSKERFRTYSVQNNIYRYDLGVTRKGARASLLDRDGDGKFEVRLPFGEAKLTPPDWIKKLTMSPRRLLNQSRIPVLRDARLLQKTGFQRGQEGPALPILALFFIEESKPPSLEDQVNPSVAQAILMERMQKEFEGKVFCLGMSFEPMPRKEMTQVVKELNLALGSKVKKVPCFALFTVQKGINRKTKRQVLRLKYQLRVREKILLREEMDDLQERLSRAIRAFLRDQE